MVAVPETPWMSEEEIALFLHWLPRGGTALEFGCGGSTRFFFEQGILQLTSVEGDPEWGKSVLADPFLSFFVQKKRLTFLFPEIGPVQKDACSLPAGPPSPLWLNYHASVWAWVDCAKLDFILIDGRFRLACALQSMARCPHRPTVLLHDFWNRKKYQPILYFMDVLDRAGTSVVLRQKKHVDWRRLILLLQHAQFDPS